jgi:hypothetical protein
MRFRPAQLIHSWSLPAAATQTITSPGGDDPAVAVEINFGTRPPPRRPNWLRVAIADEAWSTFDFDDVTEITVRQSFDDGHLMQIDAVEPEFTAPPIEIRLLTAIEGDDMVRVGYVRIFDQALHPILCDFGES